MSRLLASPVKPFWLTCDRTRHLPLSHVRPGSSGIGPWWTAGRRTMWRYILLPMWECCCGQTPHCSPPMKRFFHRLPHPGLRLERVCCQPGDLLPPRPSPATTVAIKIAAPLGRGLMKPYLLTRRPDQWPPPVQTSQPPSEAVPGPSLLLAMPTQPSPEPTLSMVMQLLSGFQSEMKNLRNELSGSVSSLVAEAMANQAHQVPQVNTSPCLNNLSTMLFDLIVTYLMFFVAGLFICLVPSWVSFLLPTDRTVGERCRQNHTTGTVGTTTSPGVG